MLKHTISSIANDSMVTDVFRYLSAKDIENVHKTSRDFRRIIKDPVVGELLFARHWKNIKEVYLGGNLVMEYTLKDGKREGIETIRYDDKTLSCERTYEDGKPHGPFKEWWRNGQLRREGTYKDGKRDGQYKSRHENGQLWTDCTYKDGKLDGPPKAWYSNGQLV